MSNDKPKKFRDPREYANQLIKKQNKIRDRFNEEVGYNAKEDKDHYILWLEDHLMGNEISKLMDKNEKLKEVLLSASKGTAKLVEQKAKEQDKGYNMEHDYKVYEVNDLKKMGMGILIDDPYKRLDSIPPGWNPEYWGKLCFKPHKERLIIAASFIISEYDRTEYMEAVDERENDEDNVESEKSNLDEIF